MSIIAWIVLGAIAGYLAGFLVKGDEGLGVIGHIVLGIVGALVGGFLASVLFNSKPIDGPFDISSIVVATIGAIITVVVVGMVTGSARDGSRLDLTRAMRPGTAGTHFRPNAHRVPVGVRVPGAVGRSAPGGRVRIGSPRRCNTTAGRAVAPAHPRAAMLVPSRPPCHWGSGGRRLPARDRHAIARWTAGHRVEDASTATRTFSASTIASTSLERQ